MTLFRSLGEISNSFRVILLNAVAVVIAKPQTVLSIRVVLSVGLDEPFHRGRVILFHALAFIVAVAQTELSFRQTLLRRLAV